MDFEKIKITDITPAEYNPRKISDEEYSKLVESISKFGLVDPIIINLKNNTIIGGHQRYDVLMDKYLNNEIDGELFLLRVGLIGWVTSDKNLILSNEDLEEELLIRLNTQAGMWDYDKLSQIYNDLEVGGFDVSLTGFLPTEINLHEEEVDKLFDDAEEELLNEIGFDDLDKEEGYEDIILTSQNTSYNLEFNSYGQEQIWNRFLDYVNSHSDEGIISQKILKILGDCIGKD